MAVHNAFMRLSIAIEKYLDKVSGEDTPDTVSNYLNKISGVSASMSQLMSAARSASCKRILSVDPFFDYLPKQGISVSLPVKKDDWLEKEYDLLGYFNDTKEEAARSTRKTGKMCQKLAEQQRTGTITQARVHCEDKKKRLEGHMTY